MEEEVQDLRSPVAQLRADNERQQLVYLRNYGVKDRHKISDLLSPLLCQVIWTLKEGGSEYTIAHVGDLSKVRHMHRSLLLTTTFIVNQ